MRLGPPVVCCALSLNWWWFWEISCLSWATDTATNPMVQLFRPVRPLWLFHEKFPRLPFYDGKYMFNRLRFGLWSSCNNLKAYFTYFVSESFLAFKDSSGRLALVSSSLGWFFRLAMILFNNFCFDSWALFAVDIFVVLMSMSQMVLQIMPSHDYLESIMMVSSVR